VRVEITEKKKKRERERTSTHLFETYRRVAIVCQSLEQLSAFVGAVGEEVKLGASENEGHARAMARELWHPLLTASIHQLIIHPYQHHASPLTHARLRREHRPWFGRC
jgi:hypothetical protein